jgi:acyl-coenzyme A synthetase/AMP-(fatty) acid ligase
MPPWSSPPSERALDVERVACGLLALDIRTGEAVALWAPSTSRATLVQLAVARVGAELVALDGDWPADALASALVATAPRVIVVEGAGRLAMLVAIRDRVPQLERLVVLDGPPPPGSDDIGWSELLVAGSAVDPRRLVERVAAVGSAEARRLSYGGDPCGPR